MLFYSVLKQHRHRFAQSFCFRPMLFYSVLKQRQMDICILNSFRPMLFYSVLKPQIHIASTQHTATCPTSIKYCYSTFSSIVANMTGFLHMLTYLFYLTFQNVSVLAYMRMDSKWPIHILPYNFIVHSFYKANTAK